MHTYKHFSLTTKTITQMFKELSLKKKRKIPLCRDTSLQGILNIIEIERQTLRSSTHKKPYTHHNKNPNPHPTLIKIFLLSRTARK